MGTFVLLTDNLATFWLTNLFNSESNGSLWALSWLMYYLIRLLHYFYCFKSAIGVEQSLCMKHIWGKWTQHDFKCSRWRNMSSFIVTIQPFQWENWHLELENCYSLLHQERYMLVLRELALGNSTALMAWWITSISALEIIMFGKWNAWRTHQQCCDGCRQAEMLIR